MHSKRPQGRYPQKPPKTPQKGPFRARPKNPQKQPFLAFFDKKVTKKYFIRLYKLFFRYFWFYKNRQKRPKTANVHLIRFNSGIMAYLIPDNLQLDARFRNWAFQTSGIHLNRGEKGPFWGHFGPFWGSKNPLFWGFFSPVLTYNHKK